MRQSKQPLSKYSSFSEAEVERVQQIIWAMSMNLLSLSCLQLRLLLYLNLNLSYSCSHSSKLSTLLLSDTNYYSLVSLQNSLILRSLKSKIASNRLRSLLIRFLSFRVSLSDLADDKASFLSADLSFSTFFLNYSYRSVSSFTFYSKVNFTKSGCSSYSALL